jgi:hypothetical protein
MDQIFWVFLRWQVYIFLCTYNLSGGSFVVRFFSQENEAKLNQGDLKNGQDHNLGDAPDISLHQQKSRFANLKKKISFMRA